MPAPDGEERSDLLVVARVRRPHGVRGEVLLAVDTDRPEHVFRVGRELRVGDGSGAPSGRTVVIDRVRPANGGLIVAFEGVSTREAADGLRGTVLLLPAEEAASPRSGEVHYRDLVGLTAVAAGEAIGRVDDILETGGGELLVVRTDAGREILVPFVKAIVRDVDLEERVLRLELPDGFLEI